MHTNSDSSALDFKVIFISVHNNMQYVCTLILYTIICAIYIDLGFHIIEFLSKGAGKQWRPDWSKGGKDDWSKGGGGGDEQWPDWAETEAQAGIEADGGQAGIDGQAGIEADGGQAEADGGQEAGNEADGGQEAGNEEADGGQEAGNEEADGGQAGNEEADGGPAEQECKWVKSTRKAGWGKHVEERQRTAVKQESDSEPEQPKGKCYVIALLMTRQ